MKHTTARFCTLFSVNYKSSLPLAAYNFLFWDVSRVDGQLAVARAFGDKSLKEHLSSEPDVAMEVVDDETEFVILTSDGIWKVMSNQEAVDCIKNVKDAKAAAKQLTYEALARRSSDDISCVVVRFK